MAREHMLLGTQRELIVLQDLTQRGFETFTALGNTSFDIVAHKAGECVRIEVKGQGPKQRKTCKGPVGTVSGGSIGDCRLYDVRATVLRDNSIRYQRSIAYPLDPASVSYELICDNEEYDKNTTHRISRKA